MKRQDGAALAFIIGKHFGELLFVIAGDAVRQHADGIAAFGQIEAGGFDAGRGVCAGDVEPGNAVSSIKAAKASLVRALLLVFVKM